jgi:chemotaxis protein methyltransferase CheR
MLFAEQPEQWRGWTIDILGSDVSNGCVDRARAGNYSQFEVQRGLGINQMIKWFEECADGWRAVEALRKPVRFQVHNLLEPSPHPGDFDIVLCRNVLLYLSPEKKALAFERIAGAMASDGWLMLGAGETVIGQTSKLGADINARGLYRLVGDGARVEKRAAADRRAATGA